MPAPWRRPNVCRVSGTTRWPVVRRTPSQRGFEQRAEREARVLLEAQTFGLIVERMLFIISGIRAAVRFFLRLRGVCCPDKGRYEAESGIVTGLLVSAADVEPSDGFAVVNNGGAVRIVSKARFGEGLGECGGNKPRGCSLRIEKVNTLESERPDSRGACLVLAVVARIRIPICRRC